MRQAKKNNDITLGLRTGMHDKGNRLKGCEGFSYKVRINGKKRNVNSGRNNGTLQVIPTNLKIGVQA